MKGAAERAGLITAALTALTLVLPVGTAQAAAPAGPGPVSQVRIDPAVTAAIEARGSADVMVLLDEQADLSAAASIGDWAERGRYVVDRLTETAERTQGALLADLAASGAGAVSFWGANAVLVRGGDTAAMQAVQRHPGVAEVTLAGSFALPEPAESQARPNVDDVEWGVAAVRAPQVWQEYGTRGEGIVVATIDSGVQYDHPAVVGTYRGNTGDGFDHDYNWFDPSRTCGTSGVPCDNAGHGTHVTGTILGDGGAGNRIGVAPGARWIAAKGCESNSCSLASLTASMQWMLAPTDRSGANPRPDLRPHVVNNSWGGPGQQPALQQLIRSWVAAGIVPVFSAGNDGPNCNTVGTPGVYAESITVGAVDVVGAVAWFSSRGAGFDQGDPVKPDVAAPGVDVRSSLPGNGYGVYNGTSMAAPHVTGSVALLMSAAPVLAGDVDGVRELVQDSAQAVNDLSCGGTTEDNNVYGHGRLDAFGAVGSAARGPVGSLRGSVLDADGAPLDAATVTVTGDRYDRTVQTAADGSFGIVAPVGRLRVEVRRYGYAGAGTDVDVTEGETSTVELRLTSVPRYRVSGTVRTEAGETIGGVQVSLVGTPLPAATTGPDGRFELADVAAGEYRLTAYGSRCIGTGGADVEVGGDVEVDVTAPDRADAFGYSCRETPSQWITGDTDLSPGSGSGQERTVPLPFPFRYYGEFYSSVEPFSNGEISLRGRRTVEIDAFRTLLFFDDQSAWRTKVVGTAPNRVMAIEWHNVLGTYYNSDDGIDYLYRLSVEVLLGEDGSITVQWDGIDGTPANDPLGGDRGRFARVGIDRFDGTSSLTYSAFEPVLRNEVAVRFTPPAAGTLTGVVTDGPQASPLPDATVVLRDQAGAELRRVRTGADGSYRIEVPVGTHQLHVGAAHYEPYVQPVTASADNERLTRDVTLATGRLSASVDSVVAASTRSGTQRRTFEVTNTGNRPMTFQVAETRAPAAPGTRVAQWSSGIPGSVTIGGIGVDQGNGNVWVIDRFNRSGHEFLADGTPTGRVIPIAPDDLGGDPVDATYDPVRRELCVALAGYNPFVGRYFSAISCLSTETGQFTWALPNGFYPWPSTEGIAYRPDTDTFYVGDRVYDQRQLFQIAGRTHQAPGAILNSCRMPAIPVAGLAWNPATRELWAGNNGQVSRVEPEHCKVLGTFSAPGESLDVDAEGRIWSLFRRSGTVYATDPGIPVPADQPWLTVTGGGTVAPGRSATVTVDVDSTGLAPGQVRRASLLVTSDTGLDHGVRQLPVVATRPLYQLGVNAGGDRVRDSAGDLWEEDRRLGHRDRYGWTGRSDTERDRHEDDRLTRDARVGDFGYEFRDLPDGVYEVELHFADHWRSWRSTRTFDVTSDGTILLDAYTPPRGRTDVQRVTVAVTGGVLRLSFLPRDDRYNLDPILNAIRITHRPDL